MAWRIENGSGRGEEKPRRQAVTEISTSQLSEVLTEAFTADSTSLPLVITLRKSMLDGMRGENRNGNNRAETTYPQQRISATPLGRVEPQAIRRRQMRRPASDGRSSRNR